MGTITVQLEHCKVKALRADMIKGSVVLQFEAALDQQVLEAKRLLGILAFDESPVQITVTEEQMRLPLGASQQEKANAQADTD